MMMIIIITAIGLSPSGSGYFTCIQNMKLITNKFKSGGLPECGNEPSGSIKCGEFLD